MRHPQLSTEFDLPGEVTIYEVSPRDGLQNESAVVPTEAKIELIERLIDAGLTTIETTSFVHPKWVPQLADADQVLRAFNPAGPVGMPVLVPNEAGLERAVEAGARWIAIFGSATEGLAKANLNRTVDTQFDMFAPVVDRARGLGLDVRAYVSMCFGDPWQDEVPIDQVVAVGKRLFDLGATQLALGDTIGVATPAHVTALIEAFGVAGIKPESLAVHLHDTYGQALSNAYAALRAGIRTFDSSAGGLGGCPFTPGATGNLATEDLVWMLEGLGIRTGVNLEALVETSVWMEGVLGRRSESRVLRALTSTA